MMHHHKEVRNDAPCAKRYKMMLGLEIDRNDAPCAKRYKMMLGLEIDMYILLLLRANEVCLRGREKG